MTSKQLPSLLWLGLMLACIQPQAQYSYLGTWNDDGVPDYLFQPNDEIDLEFWEDINLALPEQQSVPDLHPEYLDSTNQLEISFDSTTDVYMTFVHEGAGWKNSIAYYTYEQGDEPQDVEDISNLTIIYPNSSYEGSGGGLESGNKVHLGTLDSGMVMGFALIARGWQQHNASVENILYTIYGQSNLNPESTSDLQQHIVALRDDERELLVYGFEDINREWSSCDHDFNDAIFYVTADNFDALDTEDVYPFDQSDVSCYSVPENLGVSEVKLYKATASWEAIDGADEYRIRYRKWNSGDSWEYRNAGADTSIIMGAITPLDPSTYYEWQVAVTCGEVQTYNSVKHVFRTLIPCDMPAGLQVQNLQSTSAKLVWAPVPDIDHYILRFRPVGDDDWEWRNCGEELFYDCDELLPGTTYEWSVNSFCSEIISCFAPYGMQFMFTTLNEGQLAPPQPEPECDDENNYASWQVGELTSIQHIIEDWQVVDLEDGQKEIYFTSDQPGIYRCPITDGIAGEVESIISSGSFASIEVQSQADQKEIITTDPVHDRVVIWVENPAGNWEARLQTQDIIMPAEATWLGENSFAVTGDADEKIHVFEFSREKHASWTADEVAEEAVPPLSTALVAHDFDQNGSRDPFFLSPFGNSFGLSINRLNLDTMQLISSQYPLDMRPSCSLIADLNQDGLDDVVIGSADAQAILVFENISTPGQLVFQWQQMLPVDGSPSCLSFVPSSGQKRAQLLVGYEDEMLITSFEVIDAQWIGFTEALNFDVPFKARKMAAIDKKVIVSHEDGLTTLSPDFMVFELTEHSVVKGAQYSVLGPELVSGYRWFLQDHWGKALLEDGAEVHGTSTENLILDFESTFEGSTLMCEVTHGACGRSISQLTKVIPLGEKGPLHLFPNPTNEFINVEYKHRLPGEFSITINNTEGKRMMEQWFEREPGIFKIRLDVQVYNPGVYFLTVSNERQSFSEKFVVN